ncbi:MAG: DeoR/GlpR family DNA-binding transcription regulator [Bacillota bacterium]|nr:DeoR/GlpR family DNA-binding transcription regulator [Bacillota bacterium]
MLKQARLSKIESLVNEKKYVSLHELMSATKSSESTIRADLIELSDNGKLIRLRGGAQALNDNSLSFELNVEAKMKIEPEAKRKIGQFAASLIPHDSFVYIDAGTSTFFLLDYISTDNAKFVTNSVIIARKLKSQGHTVYMIGGEFKSTTDAFIGPLAMDTVSKFTFDLGFFGCNGVDKEQGITTPEFEEAMVKKAAMAQCKKLYVLADHTKFGKKTAVVFHPYTPEEIITDYCPESFKGEGIKEIGK